MRELADEEVRLQDSPEFTGWEGCKQGWLTQKSQWSSDWGYWMRTEKKRLEIVHYSRGRTVVGEGSVTTQAWVLGTRDEKAGKRNIHGASGLYVCSC